MRRVRTRQPMSSEVRVCALIPAFNEAESIGSVIRGVRPQVETVILIDDGSSDATADIAEAAGAVCLRRQCNGGKGAALREGIDHIAGCDFSHVLFLDGDGQHRPEDIPSLLRVAQETAADLVIGTRPFDRALMPRERYFSNSVGSRIASWLVGREIADSQSGFRLVRLDKLIQLKLRARKYEIEMEVLIKMSMAGCTIAHAPVGMVYDNGKARSKMKPVRDTVHICLWSLLFRFLNL
jgi:glycosyltransferase involved in cell wall biosynthesis